MSDGLRLLIASNPLWQQGGMDHPLPVHVEKVYMVMGRYNNLWKTIVTSTKDLYVARQALQLAYKTKKFDRLVISEGRSINKAPATRWSTIETVIYTPSRFETIMKNIHDTVSDSNPVQLPKDSFLHGHKQSQNFLLALACLLAWLDHSPPALSIVAFLAICEVFFMLDNRPLSVARAKVFNDMRNWAYATLNGALLLIFLLF